MTPVTPNNEQEKRQGYGQPPAQSTKRYTKRQNMSDNTDSLAQPKEQSHPRVFLMLSRNPNQELKGI